MWHVIRPYMLLGILALFQFVVGFFCALVTYGLLLKIASDLTRYVHVSVLFLTVVPMYLCVANVHPPLTVFYFSYVCNLIYAYVVSG